MLVPLADRRRIVGHVDRVEGGDTLVGWAADRSAPDRRLIVECVHEGRVLATAIANEPRDDLAQTGIGDGAYGFRFAPPPDLFLDLHDPLVQVRVQGTTRHLNPRDIRLRTDIFLWFIAADIVNNCNLRCPFCLVDYSGIKKTELMTEETFANLMRLVKSVPDGSFYLSCLHEPTLHPRLNELLTRIPADARRKVFFTTNLARPMKEADFEVWAQSGLHHINVSLDSLDASRFARLRKFGRFDVFKANLDRMASIFGRTAGAPRIRYITMAFKSNLDEIVDIVRMSREQWLSSENEIRYTFNAAHITDEFREQEYLHHEDWAVLTDRLNASGYPVLISYPPEGADKTSPSAQSVFDLPEPATDRGRVKITKPMGLRAAYDGTIVISDAEDALRVNVNSLEDPVHFFRALIRQAHFRSDGALLYP
jgi:MoaA/NifB/PqqE/SkfB family radical SAM enzyme